MNIVIIWLCQAYQTALEHKDDGAPAENSTSEKSASYRATMFPVDIFGFGVEQSHFHVAHLIPNSVTAGKSYWFVVPFLFNTPSAYDDNNIRVNAADDTWTSVQCSRLLNGTCRQNNNNNGAERPTRISHIGDWCKTSEYNINNIGLTSQKVRYDDNPHIIIVPIMTPEEMR